MPTQVDVVNVSGDALDWLRFVAIAQLAVGLVLIVALVALVVVVAWRS